MADSQLLFQARSVCICHAYTFRKIIKKIDTNDDGSVSLRELAEWIQNVNDNYYVKDANKQFVVLDTDKDGFVTFNEYAKSMGLHGMYVYVCASISVSICATIKTYI